MRHRSTGIACCVTACLQQRCNNNKPAVLPWSCDRFFYFGAYTHFCELCIRRFFFNFGHKHRMLRNSKPATTKPAVLP
jgi:hypothetical protein